VPRVSWCLYALIIRYAATENCQSYYRSPVKRGSLGAHSRPAWLDVKKSGAWYFFLIGAGLILILFERNQVRTQRVPFHPCFHHPTDVSQLICFLKSPAVSKRISSWGRNHVLYVRRQHRYKLESNKKSPLEMSKRPFLSWYQLESNQRHKDFQSFALPTEL
jgi:hypothetical protein